MDTTLAHDLRGPLVTIEGFHGELEQALDELETLLRGGASPSDVAARLPILLEEDLRPCLAFIARAAGMMHERIDRIDATAEETPADGR